MAKKLINSSIEPKCAYCANGTRSSDKKRILCTKRGVMLPDSSCGRFVYDILKREPRPKPRLPEFDKSDFEL